MKEVDLKCDPFTESNDILLAVRRTFIDLNMYKIVQAITITVTTIHIFVTILQLIYISDNFTRDLVVKYGCTMLLELYGISCGIWITLFRKKMATFFTTVYGNLFWANKTQKITKNPVYINGCVYASMGLLLVTGIGNTPLFGNNDELYLWMTQEFTDYFGPWLKILTFFASYTIPIAAFFAFQVLGHFIFYVLTSYVRLFSFSGFIQSILNDEDKDEIGEEYQDEIFKRLSFCVKQHQEFIRYKDFFTHVITLSMLYLSTLGGFCTVWTFFLILKTTDDNYSFIFKCRIILWAVCDVFSIAVYCECGQITTNGFDRIFNVLQRCPWYRWNKKNRQIFLVFTNVSMKPQTFTIAGFVLNYSFGVSLLKIGFSYALVLRKLY